MASISSPTGGKMVSYDDCYLCNWHMTGPWKRHKGYSGCEVWCGAGRPEFHSGGVCPTRLPVIEVELSLADDGHLLDHEYLPNGTPELVLKAEVSEWMKKSIPESRLEASYDDLVCLRFDSPESYTLFKLFWL